ncbi:MAG TPA: hypothetical protein VL651_04445 [Bacteroidia bacterium]|jgi:hypothetical protein|nr:hypothetical protein [Bacteroidia bacterium]
MPRSVAICFSLLMFLMVSCGTEKVCSGLNPTLATYNSNGKLRKGGKGMSAPERQARKHRMKSNKKKSGLKSRSAYSGHGLFHISFHGHAHAGGHASAKS